MNKAVSDYRFIGFIDPTHPELKKYSFCKAITGAAGLGGKRENSLESEISLEIGKAIGRTTEGRFIPTNLPFNRDGQRTTSATAYGATINAGQGGANLVATNMLAASFIDVLRNKMRVAQLGATILDGLVGISQIPRQASASTPAWISPEGADAPESEGVFDSVTLTPKTVGIRAQFSRQLLLTAAPSIEQLVRNDLSKSLAVAIDAAAIAGTGASGQPTGIINTAGLSIVPLGTNGASLASLDPLIQLETAIMNQNADDDDLAYLTNAKQVGVLKTLKDTTGESLWRPNFAGARGPGVPVTGVVNGYPAWRSNNVPQNLTKGTGTNLSAIIFGGWSNLLIGEWGVLEILPNPYGAGYNSGSIDIRALQTVDVKLRHTASFAAILDAA